MSVLRCGILGAGFMGRTHAAHLAVHPKAALVAACDADLEKAGSLARDVTGGGDGRRDRTRRGEEPGRLPPAVPPFGARVQGAAG